MHVAYLNGHDNLEMLSHELGEAGDSGRGSGRSSGRSSKPRVKSNHPSAQKEAAAAPGGNDSPEQVGNVEEESEVVADESCHLKSDGGMPLARSHVSMNARASEGMGQAFTPPPRSQAFVQYFTSKEIRRKEGQSERYTGA